MFRVRDPMPPGTAFGKRHVVTALSTAAGQRRLFAVGFGRDESVYVQLPYFSEVEGVLFRLTGRVDDNGRVLTKRTDLAHTTGNRAKFSYHPSGRAHFAETDRVRPVVNLNLPPLALHEGPLFQIHACGLGEYSALRERDRKIVDCTADPAARGVIVTGHVFKPGVGRFESVGPPRLLARTPYSPMIIALEYKPLVPPASYEGSHLLFSGGPTDPSVIGPGATRSQLMAIYPRDTAMEFFPDAPSADYVAHGDG